MCTEGVAPSQPTANLLNPTKAVNDAFGKSVAVSDQWGMVSRFKLGEDSGADRAEHQIWRAWSTDSFVQPRRRRIWNIRGRFGNIVLVDAPFDDTNVTNSGTVYVYDVSGSNPGLPIASFRKPTPVMNDQLAFPFRWTRSFRHRNGNAKLIIHDRSWFSERGDG